MSSDEHSDKPVMALLLTEHEAGLLNAALSHYRGHLRRHTPVWADGDEMQRAAPDIEELQRSLVEEARLRTVPPSDVEVIAKLAQLNKARNADRTSDEKWQKAHAQFRAAHEWLVQHSIATHFSGQDGSWHLGNNDACKKPRTDEEWRSEY